jgi:hypothetical protein
LEKGTTNYIGINYPRMYPLLTKEKSIVGNDTSLPVTFYGHGISGSNELGPNTSSIRVFPNSLSSPLAGDVRTLVQIN